MTIGKILPRQAAQRRQSPQPRDVDQRDEQVPATIIAWQSNAPWLNWLSTIIATAMSARGW